MDENISVKCYGVKIFEFFKKWCAYIIFQYELITCVCMFEPWERHFISILFQQFFFPGEIKIKNQKKKKNSF